MKILLPIIVVVILLFLYVRYLESTSVFFPSRSILATPKQSHLDFEDVYFKTKDGVTLNGWLVKHPKAKSTIVFFHGNAGNLSDRIGKFLLFHKMGVNVFAVDYRGYGNSGGKPTEEGIYEDAEAAFDYLLTRSDINPKTIISYGASLGGVVAIDLAIHRPLAGLIIDSSFSSAPDMAKVIYPFLPSFFMKIKMDSISKIQKIHIPKLFLHSDEDETVPIALGLKLYKAAQAPKTFIKLKGAHDEGHIVDQKMFVDSITRFLKQGNFI